MNVSITRAKFDEKHMWLALFPLLQRATPLQLSDYDLSPRGIHWDELNEDLSLDGLLSPVPLAAS